LVFSSTRRIVAGVYAKGGRFSACSHHPDERELPDLE
jgi:hypothetical protein